MEVSVSVNIAKPKENVWKSIIDIDNCMDMISTILAIEVLNRPAEGIIDLRWKETRLMFGKEASETMWITDAVDNSYYRTRAESHGSIYISTLSVESIEDQCTKLTMTFHGEAQSLLMKILSVLINPFMKGSMEKMLLKDLLDIKAFVENNS